jgi:hypothetical protein
MDLVGTHEHAVINGFPLVTPRGKRLSLTLWDADEHQDCTHPPVRGRALDMIPWRFSTPRRPVRLDRRLLRVRGYGSKLRLTTKAGSNVRTRS